MNLLLLFPGDLVAAGRARVTGRRHGHAREVLRTREGDEIAVGLLNGRIGTGTVTLIGAEALEMDVRLDLDPPAALPVTIVLALPRPKVLRRALYSLAVLGVKRIVLVNAARVEKSYWQSPFLSPEAVRHRLLLGLEQSCDTVLPDVVLKPRFRPFAEDELPALAAGTCALAAQPGAADPCPRAVRGPITLVIGPEGGWVPFETALLTAAGCRAVSIGERILNVETAVSALIGRLLP